MPTDVASLATSSSAPETRMLCAEIRGGNRAVDGPISLPGVRGWLYSQPCNGGRGGDIHYLAVCGSGLLSRYCLADVAGHGQAVAAVGGEIHKLLRRYIDWPDQRRFLRDLNRRLARGDLGFMTTAAAVTYYPPWRRLSVSYAGHPAALFYEHAAQRWAPLSLESISGLVNVALAVDARTTFTQRVRRVRPGDRLLLMTDGVLEAPAPNRDQFGLQRLQAVLDARHGDEPADFIGAIVSALRSFTGDDELRHDDVTALLLEFTEQPPRWTIWQVLKNRLVRPLLRRPRFATD